MNFPDNYLIPRIKPFHQEEAGIIYCGRAEEILPHLQFDLIITDPPYGIKHPCDFHKRGRGKLAKCSNYADVVGDNQPFDPRWLLEFKKPLCLWGANYFADKLPSKSGWLVWDKKRPDELDQATAELAWTDFVKGARVFRYLWNGMIRAGHDDLCHPTQKPVALMKWCLSLKWTPVGMVCDPYMGSGSTCIAAKELGRKFIGIEISEEYCRIAVKRLRQNVLNFGFGS
jgi:site-specific DNA-methyltransferase (adenine-specific)